MVTVACKELKNRLGKYLAMVRKGETVQITDRGRLIASILPARNKAQQEDAEMLARLIGDGTLTLGTGKLRGGRRPTVMTKGKAVAEMVAEDRR